MTFVLDVVQIVVMPIYCMNVFLAVIVVKLQVLLVKVPVFALHQTNPETYVNDGQD